MPPNNTSGTPLRPGSTPKPGNGAFRFEVIVPDRNLPEVLRRLRGLAQISLPEAIVEVPAAAGGDAIALLRRFIDARGVEEFDKGLLREFQEEIGRAPGGTDYLVRNAMDQGIIRRVSRGRFAVQRLLAAPAPRGQDGTGPPPGRKPTRGPSRKPPTRDGGRPPQPKRAGGPP